MTSLPSPTTAKFDYDYDESAPYIINKTFPLALDQAVYVTLAAINVVISQIDFESFNSVNETIYLLECS